MWFTVYIHFRGFMPSDAILLRAKFTLRPSLDSLILAALLHGSPAVGVSQTLRRRTHMELRNFRTKRHLYLAEWSSRWASAHILFFVFYFVKYQRNLTQFLLLDFKMYDIRRYEPYSPHLINVVTLPCESRHTENACEHNFSF